MALRFYAGGTSGLKDGTLISNGDGSAPIVFDGMYPGSADIAVSKIVMIRADEGEEWCDVNISLKAATAISDANVRIDLAAPDAGYPGSLFFYPWVGSANKPVQLIALAKPTDTGSPDTRTDLCVNAWRLV